MPHARTTAPRKIGVLTFHRCINYGSYWQARCLVGGLRDMGHDAVLLDHDCPDVTRAEWRCAFQPALPERTPRSELSRYKRKTRIFLKAVDALPLSAPFSLHAPEAVGGFDAVVVGSDEVWNMRHPWYGAKPIFYGAGLRAERLVSYAASFGSHHASEGLDPWWSEHLRRFTAISVRDDNSRNMIRGALGTEPELVLDPCLQFPEHASEGAPAEGGEPYLALYGHGFPDWFAGAVRRWADGSGLRIVSIGYHNRWADEQRIEADPHDFASAIAGAAAVATNFFHGCVFSLLNGRPFATALTPYRFNKIVDLMALVGAERHLTRDGDSDDRFDALLGAPLDPAIHRRLDALRQSSGRYLAHALA